MALPEHKANARPQPRVAAVVVAERTALVNRAVVALQDIAGQIGVWQCVGEGVAHASSHIMAQGAMGKPARKRRARSIGPRRPGVLDQVVNNRKVRHGVNRRRPRRRAACVWCGRGSVRALWSRLSPAPAPRGRYLGPASRFYHVGGRGKSRRAHHARIGGGASVGHREGPSATRHAHVRSEQRCAPRQHQAATSAALTTAFAGGGSGSAVTGERIGAAPVLRRGIARCGCNFSHQIWTRAHCIGFIHWQAAFTICCRRDSE